MEENMCLIMNPIPSALSENQWLKISCTGVDPTPQVPARYFHSSHHYLALEMMIVGKTISELLRFPSGTQGMDRKFGSTSSLA